MKPKPNEVWLTRLGNCVLIVEHPMTEVEGNLGFIWYDKLDKNLNFSPLKDQLIKKLDMNITEWAGLWGI